MVFTLQLLGDGHWLKNGQKFAAVVPTSPTTPVKMPLHVSVHPWNRFVLFDLVNLLVSLMPSYPSKCKYWGYQEGGRVGNKTSNAAQPALPYVSLPVHFQFLGQYGERDGWGGETEKSTRLVRGMRKNEKIKQDL